MSLSLQNLLLVPILALLLFLTIAFEEKVEGGQDPLTTLELILLSSEYSSGLEFFGLSRRPELYIGIWWSTDGHKRDEFLGALSLDGFDGVSNRRSIKVSQGVAKNWACPGSKNCGFKLGLLEASYFFNSSPNKVLLGSVQSWCRWGQQCLLDIQKMEEFYLKKYGPAKDFFGQDTTDVPEVLDLSFVELNQIPRGEGFGYGQLRSHPNNPYWSYFFEIGLVIQAE